MTNTTRRPLLVALIALAAGLAACSVATSPVPSPSGPPSPTTGPTAAPSGSGPAPTPTPVVGAVASPEQAAGVVLGLNPLFGGAIRLTPDIIGASKWWEAEALPDGGYRITVTVGWGDCPAGCINRHTWTYDVQPDGSTTLVDESGEPVPSGPGLPD